MRRDKEDGVPVPILRWQSEQQRDVWASRPSQRVRQPISGQMDAYVTKKMVYQCPFCDGKVSSNVMTGQKPWQRVRHTWQSQRCRKHMHTWRAKRPCGQPARRGESACSTTHQQDARAHRRVGRARKRKKHRLGHAAEPPRAAREMTMESMKQWFAPWELAAWTVRPCLCRSASAAVLVLWSRGAFSSASILSNLPAMTSHMAAVMF